MQFSNMESLCGNFNFDIPKSNNVGSTLKRPLSVFDIQRFNDLKKTAEILNRAICFENFIANIYTETIVDYVKTSDHRSVRMTILQMSLIGALTNRP